MTTTRSYPHPRGEARAAIEAAARRLFAERGYEGTSLKDLAAESDASVTLIYRYFGSKTGLFDAVLVEPGRELVEDFLRAWGDRRSTADRDEVVADLVARLHAFVADHRGLVLAWSEARRSDPENAIGGGRHGTGLRALATALLRQDDTTDGDAGPETVVACTAAMVVSAVLMEDVLFPPGSALVDPADRVAAITRFAQAGARAELGPADRT